MLKALSASIAAALFVSSAVAQESRAAEIEAQREEKARHLEPDTPDRVERALQVIKEKKILERITSGVAGVRVKLGGLVSGSGFAVGPEYLRRDLLRDRMIFRASARGSIRKYYLVDTELSMPRLADDHVFVNLYAVHRNYPSINYYGPGPRSAKTGRSDYMLEDTSASARFGVRPVRHFNLGIIGEYLAVNVGPGRDDRFVSADRIYNESSTPGISEQSDFGHYGAFVQYDYRDNPGGPRVGGNYLFEASTFTDLELKRGTFNRYQMEVQQYIPFFNQRRVIALRGRSVLTDPHEGQVVPFYLQSVLGGSDDLRGFRPFRFYNNNSLVFNAEYRWEVFSGLDMALFADAGKVYPRWQQTNFENLEASFGFGFRFNVRNDVFLRIDTGFSREGFQVWFKFNNVF